MGILTLFQFLLGRRPAIVEVASSRASLWLGAMFVAAAALAREYDRRDLLAQGWHLLLPFAASIALSFVQFALFYVLRAPAAATRWWPAYRAFLACFWMTAPLALFYAIPYERFLTERGAVDANVLTLLCVSAWRGYVICRVLQVLAGVGFFHAFALTLLLGDVAVQQALVLIPTPIFDVMAGLAQTPAIRAVAGYVFLTRLFGMAALLLLVPIGVMLFATRRPAWDGLPALSSSRVAPGAWLLALVPIAGLAAALPFTQPPLRIAHRVEVLLRDARYDDAVALLAATDQRGLPPHWHPPPIVGMPSPTPDLLDVAGAAMRLPGDSWVRRYYVDEVVRVYGRSEFRLYAERGQWRRFDRWLAALSDARRAELLDRAGDEIEANRREFADELPSTRPAVTATPATTHSSR